MVLVSSIPMAISRTLPSNTAPCFGTGSCTAVKLPAAAPGTLLRHLPQGDEAIMEVLPPAGSSERRRVCRLTSTY